MKTKNYKIWFANHWGYIFKRNPNFHHTFCFRFTLLDIYFNDVSGHIEILNFRVRWQKTPLKLEEYPE